MRQSRIAIAELLCSEDGTVAVEYAVMLALILMAMFGTIATIGGQTGGLWGNIQGKLDKAGF